MRPIVQAHLHACSEHACALLLPPQYLVFEYVEKNLLEVLEEHPGGLELEQVRLQCCAAHSSWQLLGILWAQFLRTQLQLHGSQSSAGEL